MATHFYTNVRMILHKVSCEWVCEWDTANIKLWLFPDYYFFTFSARKNKWYFLQQCYVFHAALMGFQRQSEMRWKAIFCNFDVFIAVMTRYSFSFQTELCRMLTWHLTSPHRTLAYAKNPTCLHVTPCADVSPSEIIVLSLSTRGAALFGEQEVLIWERNECNSF